MPTNQVAYPLRRRDGFVSEFISKPLLKGFVFGLVSPFRFGLTIMVKQAPKLLNLASGLT